MQETFPHTHTQTQGKARKASYIKMAERRNQNGSAGQEYLNFTSWPSDSYYNYLMHYCSNNNNNTASVCCQWNNCTVTTSILEGTNSSNATDYWINSTSPQRPDDNLIFTSLTSAILGVLILATIIGKKQKTTKSFFFYNVSHYSSEVQCPPATRARSINERAAIW